MSSNSRSSRLRHEQADNSSKRSVKHNMSVKIESDTPMRTSGRARKPSSKVMEMQGIPENILSDEDDDICVNAMKSDRHLPLDHTDESTLPVPSKRYDTLKFSTIAFPYYPFRRHQKLESNSYPASVRRSTTPYPSPDVSSARKGPRAVASEEVISIHDSDSDGYIPHKRDNAFVDDEAVESANLCSDFEEDQDRYESDFIDDGPISTPTYRQLPNEDDSSSFNKQQRKRPKLGSPFFLEESSDTTSQYSSPSDTSVLAKEPSESERLDTKPQPSPASKDKSESPSEHSAYSNEHREERARASSKPDLNTEASVEHPNEGRADEEYEDEVTVPLPNDDWLRPTYKHLPKLKYVLLEKTSKNQKERVDDSLLSPSMIKACFENNGLDYIQSRLFKMLTMKHYKLYANASRIDPSMIKASSSGSSTFFNTTPSMYRPAERSLSNNVCFVMTGMVAYSYLTEEAVNISSYKTTVDHRIGLYPFDGEFQRAMTLFGNLAGKDSLVYTFHGGVIPFTTRVKVGNEDQGNIIASPKKAGLFSSGIPSQSTGCNPLLSNIKRQHYPMPLAFDDKVPIFDARRKDNVFDDSDWDRLHRFPIWTHNEVPPYCLVTVGYTANTYTISSNYSTNTNSPYLSLNLQFVIVHADPITV
ncbi:hypothetical protein CC1G_10346 [Coprinopsis cinerea okayama7|uniref:Uncharacterized protein n=1 Tax=Coprinopsis cinerea (strain Okayama-7 / 130 / ATCC MYA-4618 / FGSC 9003) TaxID=240176 RepID=A8PE63_COPC7|nr:hypothetical protein CC1G_10346 [Coprinopsis cinerea okayama7\|eukprot:XP_001840732.2 hypothetical protein CC1G_10346 [Coprinopsis cinerea okayama7\